MLKLRDYQKKAVDEIRTALTQYRRVLFQLNTGGGKSCVFSYIASCSQKLGRRVLILSNRTEILKQNGGTLERTGLDVDYISPKHRDIPHKNVVVAMSQTLRRRLQKDDWREYVKSVGLLIVDEAHCCDHDFIYDYLSERCFRLLVTATPCRQGKQRQLGDFADAMVIGINTKELINRGYLTPARHFGIAAPKLDNVPLDSMTKEYNQRGLSLVYEDRRVYTGVIDEWQRLCNDKKTLMFCVSSTQAIECTKIFNERGFSARYLLSGSFDDDSTYSGERTEVIDAFKRGDFQVLVNVGIAVAGTDIPDIECIVANFATTSMSKWRQAIGRGCRISPGKDEFIIIDAGDNTRRLGFFDSEIEWSLWHDESHGGGIQMLKDCPVDKMDINHKKGCGARVPTSCKVCPACGFKFLTEKDEVHLHLEELSSDDSGDLVSWAASKKLQGWKLNRILLQCCLSNADDAKSVFSLVYKSLYPSKSDNDVRKYWYVFKKSVWDKVVTRKQSVKQNKKT